MAKTDIKLIMIARSLHRQICPKIKLGKKCLKFG